MCNGAGPCCQSKDFRLTAPLISLTGFLFTETRQSGFLKLTKADIVTEGIKNVKREGKDLRKFRLLENIFSFFRGK